MNGGKVPHFAHQSGSDCRHGLESAIHLAAKQLIEEQQKLYIPELKASVYVVDAMGDAHTPSAHVRNAGLIVFDSVRLEERVSDFRPDLIAREINGQDLLIEIAFAHFVDEIKLSKIEQHGIPAIEIDVSEIQIDSFSQLERLLFEHSPFSHWLFHPDITSIEESLRIELAPLLHNAEKESRRLEQQRKRQSAELAERVRREELRQAKLAENRRQKAESFKAKSTEEKLAFSLSFLGINEHQLPDFLNYWVPGEKSFGVPRKVWQTSVFGAFIEKSLKARGAFNLEAVLEWLSQRYEITHDPKSPNSEKVALWKFLNNLSDLGILNKGRKQWFEVRRDSLKQIIASSKKGAQELAWASEWPSTRRTNLVAKSYATKHHGLANWELLAELLPVAKSKSPEAIATYYSSNNPAAASIVLDFMLDAGFLWIPNI
jgi:hypothetical protein